MPASLWISAEVFTGSLGSESPRRSVPDQRSNRELHKVFLDTPLPAGIINPVENSIWSEAARRRFSYLPAVDPELKLFDDQQTFSLESINYKMEIS